MLTIQAYDDESLGAAETIQEALNFANKNNCQLRMNVLGIYMYIRPNALPDVLLHDYYRQAARERYNYV